MNDENKIIGNQDEEKQIPKLLRQAGQDKVIEGVVKGVKDNSLEERFSNQGDIIGLEKVAEEPAEGIKDISLGKVGEKILAVADNKGVSTYRLYRDPPKFKAFQDNRIIYSPSDSVAFIDDGNYLAAAFHAAGTTYLSVYRTSDMELIGKVENTAVIDKIESDSTSEYIAVHSNNRVRIMRGKHPKFSMKFLSDNIGLSDVSISPDGAYVVGGWNGTGVGGGFYFARIYEVPPNKPKQLKRVAAVGFDESIKHVAFSPEMNSREVAPLHYKKDYYFAVASDRILEVFKFLTPDKIEVIERTHLERPHDINSIAFGFGNSLAVTYGHIASVYNFDEENGLGFVVDIKLPDTVLKAKFSPDGNWLATACKDDMVRLYKVNRK